MTGVVSRWRTPIIVIVAGCLIAIVGFGVRSAFGLFLEPLSADRGWGREVFALAMAIQNLVWGVSVPVASISSTRSWYSSSLPVHQCTASGFVCASTWSTQACKTSSVVVMAILFGFWIARPVSRNIGDRGRNYCVSTTQRQYATSRIWRLTTLSSDNFAVCVANCRKLHFLVIARAGDERAAGEPCTLAR